MGRVKETMLPQDYEPYDFDNSDFDDEDKDSEEFYENEDWGY